MDRPNCIPTESLPSFRPSAPWASTWAILVVYAPRYREVITAMPTKAHRGAAMMRHVADIKSTHSSNDCEHQRRPLDVIMTTQPSSRRRLAEARPRRQMEKMVQHTTILWRESRPRKMFPYQYQKNVLITFDAEAGYAINRELQNLFVESGSEKVLRFL